MTVRLTCYTYYEVADCAYWGAMRSMTELRDGVEVVGGMVRGGPVTNRKTPVEVRSVPVTSHLPHP